MYPCDICHMNSERIRDKWLILSHMSKGSLKSTKGDKKGINEKEKRTSSFHFLAWYSAVRGENIFERERERESNLSLDFPMFGPSVLVGAKGEVDLRCKGYAWTPVLWSFDNFEK